ncbi:hypothetical protein GA0070213_103159 [Micromonospora humi]|uniref:Uncharacterized protein n=1 Tax=Micromonospora humi TaxID=745366 RepID=A0A1C5HID4_9ACTN|nr:hypothetical protein GA0070213_103159 [Micromonospora humi]
MIEALSWWATDESTCTPDSVPGTPEGAPAAAIHLGLPSPAGSSGLPADIGRAALKRLRGSSSCGDGPFLALLRVGFTEPPRSPGVLVGSYPTVSPLPSRDGPAVCFLWHCPAGHPGLPLATTLPCGVRTFLGGGPEPADATARSTRPSRPHPNDAPPDIVLRIMRRLAADVPTVGRPAARWLMCATGVGQLRVAGEAPRGPERPRGRASSVADENGRLGLPLTNPHPAPSDGGTSGCSAARPKLVRSSLPMAGGSKTGYPRSNECAQYP